MGFDVPAGAPPTRWCVALRLADDGRRSPAALAAVEQACRGATGARPATAADVRRRAPPASALRGTTPTLALVSVPGASALVEAMDAVDAGRDVMVFSDNVPLAQEVALKRAAAERGVLVMGPDCGTAVVGGLGLGFANATSPGPVGIVAASGTGCQQLLVPARPRRRRASRPRSASAAATCPPRSAACPPGRRCAGSTPTPRSSCIVVVSKPPAAEVAAEIEEYAAGLAHAGRARPARRRAGPTSPPRPRRCCAGSAADVPAWPVARLRVPGRRAWYLRGLFVGGTLCDEAMLVAAAGWADPQQHPAPRLTLGADLTADGHTMVDFGDDAYTPGRAHPMIDPTLRLEHLARAAADPATGVLLLDVVLGHGAEPDPAALLAPGASRGARPQPGGRRRRRHRARPAGPDRQARALAEAGAEVHLSNAARHPARGRADPREAGMTHPPTARRHRRRRPARRRRRGPGRGGDPRRLAAADGRHRGRPGHGRRRPAPPDRQRAGARGDARRHRPCWSTSRRRPRCSGCEPRRVPARRAADRAGTGRPARCAGR